MTKRLPVITGMMLMLMLMVLLLGAVGCRPEAPAPPAVAPVPVTTVAVPSTARLNIDNLTDRPRDVWRDGKVIATVPAWGIVRVTVEAGPLAMSVPGDDVAHPSIKFQAQKGRVYVWELSGTGTYTLATITPGTSRAHLGPTLRGAPMGVYEFAADLDLLDPVVEPTMGETGATVRKVVAKLSSDAGELPTVMRAILDRATHTHRSAYLTGEIALLVMRIPTAMPDDAATRLLELLALESPTLAEAVAQTFERYPQPATLPALKARLREPKLSGFTIQAVARAVAASGTFRDIDEIWRDATAHPTRLRHLQRGLERSPALMATFFFAQFLSSADRYLAQTAWEQLTKPSSIRHPLSFAIGWLFVAYSSHFDTQTQQRKLAELVAAAYPFRDHFPPPWRSRLDRLAILDAPQGPSRDAMGRMVDMGEPGLAVLAELFPLLIEEKKMDVVARINIDMPAQLTPSAEAILRMALVDPAWEVYRPAFARLGRDPRLMADETFRSQLVEIIEITPWPDGKERLQSYYDEGMRRLLATAPINDRVPGLIELALHATYPDTARHALQNLRDTVSDDTAWHAVLAELAQRIETATPTNRAVIVFAFANEIRLGRGRSTPPGIAEERVKALLVAGLSDASAEVREVAFGLLVDDAVWFGDPHVYAALRTAVEAEPMPSMQPRFARRFAQRDLIDAASRAATNLEALEKLFDALASADREIARTALSQVAQVDSAAAQRGLVARYPQFDDEMRERALSLMVCFEPLPYSLYAEALQSPNPSVRYAAFMGLARRLDMTADVRVLEMLAHAARSETDPDLSAAFTDALAKHR